MTSTLTPLTRPETSAPTPEQDRPTPGRPSRRGWVIAAALVALVAAVGLVVVIADQGDDDAADPTPPAASTTPVDGAPDSWFGGPEVSYGSVDAMERSLATVAATAPSAPVGSPDAVENWTSDASQGGAAPVGSPDAVERWTS